MPRAKKEDIFFTMFKEQSAKVLKAAETYDLILRDFPQNISHIPEMRVHEHECDEAAKRIMMELYRAFVTPIDRSDISDLTLAMDDIVDYMNTVVLNLGMFNIEKVRTEAPQLAVLTLRAVRELATMVEQLPNYKNDPTLVERSISIGNIEDEADAVYNSAVSRLFREQFPGRVTVAWLRIFDRMEDAVDACEATARVIRTIVMKSA